MTTKVPIELSSTPSIVDGGNATAITIDSSEYVGIGTTSPAYPLTVEKAVTDNWLSRIYNTGTAEGDLGLLVRTASEHDGTISLSVYSGSSYKFVVQGDGHVGIGTSSPSHPLHIAESADGTKIRLNRGGVCEWDFSIGNTSTLSGVGSGALEILPQNGGTANEFAIGTAGSTAALFHLTTSDCTFSGNVKIKGADLHFPNGLTGASSANSDVRYNTSSGQVYYQTSSKRYKKDITDLEINTTKIYELDTVSFTDKTTEDRCFGLIAEEVDKVIPELVNKKVIEGLGDDPVPDTISYSMLSVLLLKELQSTKIKLDDALARIKTLEDA